MITRLKQSAFVKSVSILLSGAIFAQLIGYLLYPVISRLYVEEDMAVLGLFTRITAFLAALATARYEIALPIASQDGHAFQLYRLILRITFILAGALAFIGLLGMLIITHVSYEWWFLVATVLSVIFLAWINSGTNWSVRMSAYKTISYQRVISSLVMNVTRLGFGLLSWGGLALLFSSLLSYVAGAAVYIRDFRRTRRVYSPSARKMRVLASEYRDFPIISLPQTLLELSADIIIAGAIEYYFTRQFFGSYSFALLILKAPLGIAGQSIGQVFFNRCSSLKNQDQSVRPLFFKTVGMLTLLAIIPFLSLYFFGSELFTMIFGKTWALAGTIAEILAPMLFLNFLLSPVSTLPMIFGKQRMALIIGLTSITNQLFWFLWYPGGQKELDFLQILTGFSFSQSILLLIVLVVYARISGASGD